MGRVGGWVGGRGGWVGVGAQAASLRDTYQSPRGRLAKENVFVTK